MPFWRSNSVQEVNVPRVHWRQRLSQFAGRVRRRFSSCCCGLSSRRTADSHSLPPSEPLGLQVLCNPPNQGSSCSGVNAYTWSSLEYDCDPLVLRLVKEELEHDKDFMRINVAQSMLQIQILEDILSCADQKVRRTIRKYESGIVEKEVKLKYQHLPVLTDSATKRKLASSDLLSCVRVNLGSMTIPLVELEDKDIACKDQSVKYQWYWFDDNTFQPFSSRESEYIEKKFVERHDTVDIHIGRFSYAIDIVQMIQTNLSTKKERPIRRIAVPSEVSLVSLDVSAYKDYIDEVCDKCINIVENSMTELKVSLPSEAMPFKLILLGTLQKNLVEAVLNETEGSDVAVVSLRGQKCHVQSAEKDLLMNILEYFPPYWTSQSDTCEVKKVLQGSAEEDFLRNMLYLQGFEYNVLEMQRIQNEWLWNAFVEQRKQIYTKNNGRMNEYLLFHGSRGVPPNDIYGFDRGFDPSCSRQGLLGRGSYFAELLEYSHKYAYKLPNGLFQVFLARVITGMSCPLDKEDRSLTTPPLKVGSGSSDRYDSTTMITMAGSIYTVYELHRAYPEYLITYKISSK